MNELEPFDWFIPFRVGPVRTSGEPDQRLLPYIHTGFGFSQTREKSLMIVVTNPRTKHIAEKEKVQCSTVQVLCNGRWTRRTCLDLLTDSPRKGAVRRNGVESATVGI